MKRFITLLLVCPFLFAFSATTKREAMLLTQYVKDYNAGVDAQAKEDYVKAIQLYQKAIAQYEEFPEAWNNLAYCNRMIAMSYLAKAGDAYDRAIKYSPNYPEALEYQGEYFITMGQLVKSFNNYKTLKDLNSDQASKVKHRLDPVLRQAKEILKNYSP